MSFLEQLETEANYTSTMNGAKTHGTSGDACLDLFAVAGAVRYQPVKEQIRLFERAYIENPELAMKLLFHIRDIREGLGERSLFRTLIRHVAKRWPESARKNVAFISEFGRFDDLMCLMGTSSQTAVIEVIRFQLAKDTLALQQRKNGKVGAHISLLAKWLPSINTSSARTRGQARVLAEALEMKPADYRKLLSSLRAQIGLTECYLTSKKADKIAYEAVPANAMLKYRRAFSHQDEERFLHYLAQVRNNKASIHTDTLFPYEILRPLFSSNSLAYRYHRLAASEEKNDVLELLWDHQSGDVAGENAISVIDTSGSMYWSEGKGPLPALISQSLGLYHAERCKGLFHNMFITFETSPHLVKIHGENLADKLSYIRSASWGGSTNLEAVFDLILRTAVNANAAKEEMPSVLYIISDMEFDCAVQNPDKTIYENAKAAFAASGYEMPAVVFHNVNSWQMQTPVKAHTKGTALTSGAATNSFRQEFDGNVTPMDHMLRVLCSDRYAMIHA